MTDVRETFNYKPLAATGVVSAIPVALGGFFCTTAGTLEVRDGGASGTIVIASFPVEIGKFYIMPFYFATSCYATMTSAAGTFAI